MYEMNTGNGMTSVTNNMSMDQHHSLNDMVMAYSNSNHGNVALDYSTSAGTTAANPHHHVHSPQHHHSNNQSHQTAAISGSMGSDGSSNVGGNGYHDGYTGEQYAGASGSNDQQADNNGKLGSSPFMFKFLEWCDFFP